MKFWTLATLSSLVITYLFFSFISWSWFSFTLSQSEGGAFLRLMYLMFSGMVLMGMSVTKDLVNK